MGNEHIENSSSNEYDRDKHLSWRRRIGEFVARRFTQGDDDVLIRRARVVEPSHQADEVLRQALDVELADTVRHADSFLLDIEASRVPASLRGASYLRDVSEDELSGVVRRWVLGAAESLTIMREDLATCQEFGDALSSESKVDFCLTVANAKESLRASLQIVFDHGISG